MSKSLQDLNLKRKQDYRKESDEENFLLRMNKTLSELERKSYKDYKIEHPFIFIFGLPRSGTTLMSQAVAAAFEVGYINNLIARFWLAPVHGIKLSKSLVRNSKNISFHSDYARTQALTDIHEFGYFWRELLNKESMEDITQVKEREKDIDWHRVRKTLANLQHEYNQPMVFKNIFGSYHLKKMKEVLEKVIYIYIERDLLDVAVSILDARRKYYDDLNTWWSYTPIEYDDIKDLNYWGQIAGQIFYLKQFYESEIEQDCQEFTVKVKYSDLCKNPRSIINSIKILCRDYYAYDLKISDNLPQFFSFRTYENRDSEKEKFSKLLDKFMKVKSR